MYVKWPPRLFNSLIILSSALCCFYLPVTPLVTGLTALEHRESDAITVTWEANAGRAVAAAPFSDHRHCVGLPAVQACDLTAGALADAGGGLPICTLQCGSVAQRPLATRPSEAVRLKSYVCPQCRPVTTQPVPSDPQCQTPPRPSCAATLYRLAPSELSQTTEAESARQSISTSTRCGVQGARCRERET
ncbi:hypothetical protein JZ751_025809 [Albula glossodonta]|uniref:Uncharacterized protein n=1 Tax=Albula glossodonta TaxID=121402 RepID=A0A8T2NDG2_9TELE|nr:hypothetical protein JZ751_025809 [Albula glossodonta]